MKIGIFGGSFNPPHNMHENIGIELIKKGYLDKIIYVPTGEEYKYKSNLLSNEIRYNMVKLVTDKHPEFGISNFEFQDKVIYTYETIRHFKEEYPNDEIYLVCGADNLSYIDKWEKGETILRNEKIIAIARNTDNIDEILSKYQKFSPVIEIATIEPIDLSSTEIRNLIKKNDYETLKKYLDQDVLDYIIKKNLYK